MSYVAEWRGGGPQDLLRGFDSFRNCQIDRFLWQQWLDQSRVVFLHRPFLWPGHHQPIEAPGVFTPGAIWHPIPIGRPKDTHALDQRQVRISAGHMIRPQEVNGLVAQLLFHDRWELLAEPSAQHKRL